jgi:hypothetical protein
MYIKACVLYFEEQYREMVFTIPSSLWMTIKINIFNFVENLARITSGFFLSANFGRRNNKANLSSSY